MKKGFFYLILLVFPLLSQSQNYNNLKFDVIDNTQGLLSDVVNCSYQDAQGYMWFGTEEGITRYDGYEFCNFKDHPHLGKLYGVDIRRITSDHQGNLLVSSKNGFIAFTPELKPYLIHIEELLKQQDIFAAMVSKDSSIYITSNWGLYIIDPQNHQAKHLVYEDKKKSVYRQMKDIVEDAEGNLWLGAWGCGLLCLNKDHEFIEYNNIWKKGHNQCAYSMAITPDQKLWVGTWHDGLYIIDISTPQKIEIIKHLSVNNSDIPGSVILDIEKDPYDNIWVSTAYGVSIIKEEDDKFILINYTDNKKRGELSNANIGHVYSGNDDLMWVSTLGGGINKLHLGQNQFEHFLLPENEGQRSQSIYGFGKDKKGRTLIGLKSLGFMIMDKNDVITPYWKHPDYRYLTVDYDINAIKCFLNYDKDWLLMGLRYQGVMAINQTTGETVSIKRDQQYQNFRGRDVEVMHKMNNGRTLVGTSQGLNIIHHRNGQWKTRFIAIEGNKNFSIQDIVTYQSDQYIIASKEKGIYLLKYQEQDYRTPELFLEIKSPVLSLYNEQNKYLWIGTQGLGLLRYDFDTKSLSNLNLKGESSGDVIYAIKGDELGNLWLTTNSGLSKLIKDKDTYHFEKFSHRDGLQSNVFIHRSFYIEDGLFYIGGHNGFNRFDPLKVESKEDVPPVVITEVKVEGQKIDNFKLNKGLHLNHKKNTFSLRFSSLAFVFPEANSYAYRIEGIAEQWNYVSADMRTANYNNMPSGDYTFYLKASNSKGIWNQAPLSFNIEVKQAPYKTIWAILFYISVFIGLTWLFFRQRLLNERIKQEVELEQIKRSKAEKLNMYKLSFFTNMSHELLTPLAILSTTMENIHRQKKFSTDTLSTMQRNVNNLNRLIKQLLTFRKVETGNMTVHYKERDISAFVTECVSDFNILAEKKNISFDIIISQNIEGPTDADKLELIIRNLLSNAFKYTAKGGNVTFNLERNEKEIILKVKDTGCGIPEQEIEKLFSRYYRVQDDKTTTNEGVGIGLNLTKSLINMMNGTIEVKSTVDIGTTFTVKLPMSSSAKRKMTDEKEDIYIDDTQVARPKKKLTEDQDISKNDFSILLVEDNDDFRTVLKDTLSPYYTVYEAINGIEGLEMAQNKDIDLILSDIMMPKMDGNELCKRIKDNKETSHISVILLTAKVGDENRKEGYKSGADSYLEKPVNFEMLNVRITSMLKQREKLRHEITNNITLEIKKIDITPFDEKFFLQVKALVEKNLDNTDFSVKDILKELTISNSMLYRKMKSLAGLSPSDYIRDVRLRHAAKMLENKSYSISEVAFSTGFNELSYFGLCFKKMYSVTPTAYQEGKRMIE